MTEHMQNGMEKHMQNDALAMLRTDGRTYGRPTHLLETSSVPERAGEIERMPVEKWVIRYRWSPMWGSPGWYWRVSHPSIPQGYPLYGSVHLYSFEDALAYACDHATAVAP